MTDNIEIILPRDVSTTVHTVRTATPTEVQYRGLQQLLDHFNRTLIEPLFGVSLPPALITMQREANVEGYFVANQFTALNGERTDEIALNPRYFRLQSAREVCSTLVHEMVHQLQFHHGKPMRNGYHDKKWGAAMKLIGLWPSNSGKPGGRETGVHMSHYIIEDSHFTRAFEELDATIEWGDTLTQEKEGPAPKPKRLKIVCPVCDFSVQAVPSAEGQLACIPCGNVPMVAAI